ncbi:hypothetical protein HMPREF1544_08779 [Mucor circinelloides 1006PhL]|uniref:C2H2-type domain-containing protein n=1 Tax=Mucor circinelloides f. circinelloides (strain 1006PhL) TaxID=1220926 RepID=S2JXB4_MUCC1|nr:hypothetical protein HMPREF1544_08779 [Mucor circinelloides 1006PhL]
MKLRNRQGHVSNNIKQEDHKSDLTLINTPSSTVNETKAFSLGIKQEDTKNYKSLLKQDDKFKGKDYYYRCDRCRQTSPNLKSVMEHRASVHNVKSRKDLMVKDINVEPDVHDPSFYCKPCKVNYTNRPRYRQHLKIVHYMILKTIPSGRIPQNIITPDPDNPDLYCRACNYTFTGKRTYSLHCQYAHGITSVKFTTARRLANKASYKKHLFAIHKLDWRLIYQKPKNRTPDVDNPNFYCRICQKNYICSSNYRTHLRCKRHIALLSLKSNASPDKLPNPNDPHNFCSVCKKSWKKRRQYRAHCKHKHFMILDRCSIINPNAMIDINDPKNYCAQCERSYARKEGFRKHLGYVHNI